MFQQCQQQPITAVTEVKMQLSLLKLLITKARLTLGTIIETPLPGCKRRLTTQGFSQQGAACYCSLLYLFMAYSGKLFPLGRCQAQRQIFEF